MSKSPGLSWYGGRPKNGRRLEEVLKKHGECTRIEYGNDYNFHRETLLPDKGVFLELWGLLFLILTLKRHKGTLDRSTLPITRLLNHQRVTSLRGESLGVRETLDTDESNV